jgi:hypothetical protein
VPPLPAAELITFVTVWKVDPSDSGVVAEAVNDWSKITSMNVRLLPVKDCLLIILVDLALVAGI